MAQILLRRISKPRVVSSSVMIRLTGRRAFSTEKSTEAGSTEPPPTFDYQAPKDDDSYKNYQSTSQFVRRYFIIFPIAALCLYDMCFVRRNLFSRNREYKFFNRPLESMLGSVVSSRIASHYKNFIYKQDTEEVKLIKSALA